jgi:hypothetical protein
MTHKITSLIATFLKRLLQLIKSEDEKTFRFKDKSYFALRFLSDLDLVIEFLISGINFLSFVQILK